MAVTPMKLVTIVGPLGDFDSMVRSCIINCHFHPENAANAMNKLKLLYPFEQDNPYSALLQKVEDLSKTAGYSLDYHDFDLESPDLGEISAYVDQFHETYTALNEEEQQLTRLILDNDQIILQLQHVHGLGVDLHSFFNLKYAKFRFGRMRHDTYESFLSHLENSSDLFIFPTSIERDYVYMMYLTTRTAEEKIDSLFASLRFERIRLSDKVTGTGEEAIEVLTHESEQAKERLRQVVGQLAQFKAGELENFMSRYSHIRYLNDAYNIRQYSAHTAESFYLVGWVPASDLSEITARLDKFDAVSYMVEDPVPNADNPPIKLKNHRIFRPFESYVTMYGLPSYDELDPTPLMAITYTLLFGIMFGDVGQGLLVSVIGLLMWKLKKMWLGRILVYAGIASTGFGFVYGSVFGFEDVLPYETFKVLESDNTNTMLMLAVFAGVFLISVAMILNMLNGIKQKNLTKLLFSPNGLAGFVFYWAIIIAVLPLLGFGDSRLTGWYIGLFVVLPLLLIFLREPLGKFLMKQKDWKPETWGGYALESGFELVEVILSYVTNTISFLRVGAFALSHAGMMLVVFLLAKGTGTSDNPIVIVLGNVLVMGIEGLLVGIQVLRLEFYELFGRFYNGEGRPYTPFIINYKAEKK